MGQIRKTNTVAAIKQAFISLLGSKGLQAMNVSDITRQAQVGRGTFYTHFQDKKALLLEVENDLLQQLHSDLDQMMPDAVSWFLNDQQHLQPAPFLLETLKSFYHNHVVVAQLFSEQGDPYFLGKVRRVIFADLLPLFDHPKQVVPVVGISLEYAREAIIDQVLGLIVYWISKPVPEPPEQILQVIVTVLNHAPASLLIWKAQPEENKK